MGRSRCRAPPPPASSSTPSSRRPLHGKRLHGGASLHRIRLRRAEPVTGSMRASLRRTSGAPVPTAVYPRRRARTSPIRRSASCGEAGEAAEKVKKPSATTAGVLTGRSAREALAGGARRRALVPGPARHRGRARPRRDRGGRTSRSCSSRQRRAALPRRQAATASVTRAPPFVEKRSKRGAAAAGTRALTRTPSAVSVALELAGQLVQLRERAALVVGHAAAPSAAAWPGSAPRSPRAARRGPRRSAADTCTAPREAERQLAAALVVDAGRPC